MEECTEVHTSAAAISIYHHGVQDLDSAWKVAATTTANLHLLMNASVSVVTTVADLRQWASQHLCTHTPTSNSRPGWQAFKPRTRSLNSTEWLEPGPSAMVDAYPGSSRSQHSSEQCAQGNEGCQEHDDDGCPACSQHQRSELAYSSLTFHHVSLRGKRLECTACASRIFSSDHA